MEKYNLARNQDMAGSNIHSFWSTFAEIKMKLQVITQPPFTWKVRSPVSTTILLSSLVSMEPTPE